MNEYPESGVVLVRQHGSYNWGKSPISFLANIPHVDLLSHFLSASLPLALSLAPHAGVDRQNLGTGQDTGGMCRLPVRDGRQDDSSRDPARRGGQDAKQAFLLGWARSALGTGVARRVLSGWLYRIGQERRGNMCDTLQRDVKDDGWQREANSVYSCYIPRTNSASFGPFSIWWPSAIAKITWAMKSG